VPTTVGRVLVAFLSQHFPHIMDYSFTSDLEGQLDSVSSG
jgi:DNA topoisomerase-1